MSSGANNDEIVASGRRRIAELSWNESGELSHGAKNIEIDAKLQRCAPMGCLMIQSEMERESDLSAPTASSLARRTDDRTADLLRLALFALPGLGVAAISTFFDYWLFLKLITILISLSPAFFYGNYFGLRTNPFIKAKTIKFAPFLTIELEATSFLSRRAARWGIDCERYLQIKSIRVNKTARKLSVILVTIAVLHVWVATLAGFETWGGVFYFYSLSLWGVLNVAFVQLLVFRRHASGKLVVNENYYAKIRSIYSRIRQLFEGIDGNQPEFIHGSNGAMIRQFGTMESCYASRPGLSRKVRRRRGAVRSIFGAFSSIIAFQFFFIATLLLVTAAAYAINS